MVPQLENRQGGVFARIAMTATVIDVSSLLTIELYHARLQHTLLHNLFVSR